MLNIFSFSFLTKNTYLHNFILCTAVKSMHILNCVRGYISFSDFLNGIFEEVKHPEQTMAGKNC